MSMDRRTFLRGAALATASAAAGMHAARAQEGGPRRLPQVDDPPSIPGVEWNKAPCRFCGTGCHVQVGVRDGRVVAVAGDNRAPVNKGLLCVKGYHVGGVLYGPDRLTQPLYRKGGKGSPLEPISWEEAIDVLSRKIMAAPERFAIYGSGQWTVPEGFVAQKLIKGGLSNNHIDPNARLCMASAVTGFISSYGVDEPASCYDDLDECDVVITWGNNPAEMHPVLFSRLMDRRSRGEQVRLIDLSTRRTRTSEHADDWILFQPSSDLAIANGIMHLLLEDGTWNREFVDNHCNFRGDDDPPTLKGHQITFEEFQAALAEYTPERVEEISGVPEAQLRMLAGLFADRELRIVSLWCMGMNQHQQGTAINNLVHSVHLLSGHWGRPGDGPQSLTGQPSACGTAREVGTLAHALPGGRVVANAGHRAQCEELWNLPPGRINPTPGHHTVKMFKNFCTPASEGGDIDCIWVQVTNPGQSLPNSHELFQPAATLAEKFLVVSEVYPTATTELADLVLPAAMWVEKNGVFGNSERRTQQWFKMVEPPGEARDDCWMTIAVAHRLMELGHEGMLDKDGKFLFHIEDDEGNEVPIWDWEHYYDVNVDEHLFEEYRPFTHLKHKNVAPYQELVTARGLRWPVVEGSDGVWRETRWRFVEGYDPFVPEGAGFDFYHSTSGDGRAQIWFRPWVAPVEQPDEAFGYWLCTGRVLEHWHTGTMTMRIPQLRRAMPQAYVEMHPDDAAAEGFQNGDEVILTTPRGEVRLPVWINGRARPPRGTLFVPFFDERLPINELTLDAIDPFSKQPDYKKCAAQVRAASPE
jgi:nitrate reductase (cytochrome)